MDDFSSSDDDDLLQELIKRPSRYTQVSSTQTQVAQTQEPLWQTNAQKGKIDGHNTNQIKYDAAEAQLLKAQGEASMLRDKIALLNAEKEKDRLVQANNVHELKASFQQDINKLSLLIQKLEDRKKFLAIENKSLLSKKILPASSPSTSSLKKDSSSSSRSPLAKKRKIESDDLLKKQFVPLNPNKIVSDETSDFFDSIVSHRIAGSELPTIEILNVIKFQYIDSFHFKTFHILKDESIGKSIINMILRCKKSMSLDRCIDTLLENLAVLIKEISFHAKESKLTVPFLVALMHQVITFRPSAVPNLALKDLFLFICDLIKRYQRVLKQSLHKSPFDLDFEPQIFQYKFIENLIVFYSFDVLETSVRILQSHPNVVFSDFLDSEVLSSFEAVYKLSLTISFKPVLNVIFNTVEILSILANILVTYDKQNDEDFLIPSSWWKDVITRLYHVLSKSIINANVYDSDDVNILSNNKFNDIYSLCRNTGENRLGNLVSKLVHKDKLQGIPRVISKDDIPSLESDKVNFQFERWAFHLKSLILNVFENIIMIYPNDNNTGRGEMFVNLSTLISKEQEAMINRGIGQDSPNLAIKVRFIENILAIIYQLWIQSSAQISQEQMKETKHKLAMALWRIIVSQQDGHSKNMLELKDHCHLVEKFHNLSLLEQVSYYDDALETTPEYVAQELRDELKNRSLGVMQVKYGDVYQEMAKNILESELGSFASMEESDSLYMAMGL
ncbi:hypothetical protein KAFR_0D04040 [Kazachstania africana CBS 2517]|uniref:DNA damage checkpoint protein LCD1 n=1 Tax=Kazachstania africana (strain ATCC 22294 / BCRC 22015 / CBS 2517 / CECT 1963 / NBRC 1671 / NRRL Y-8276) TaxID=1071382 RepID=H2AUK2_KAZAF|nr:hypothetical protein KAFR_0D04040 [Kazachstania africana CBS 2517]CCF58052.1 hypothetical protein KAFR_0D04040 [Kazachstania africana CBS 2517]